MHRLNRHARSSVGVKGMALRANTTCSAKRGDGVSRSRTRNHKQIVSHGHPGSPVPSTCFATPMADQQHKVDVSTLLAGLGLAAAAAAATFVVRERARVCAAFRYSPAANGARASAEPLLAPAPPHLPAAAEAVADAQRHQGVQHSRARARLHEGGESWRRRRPSRARACENRGKVVECRRRAPLDSQRVTHLWMKHCPVSLPHTRTRSHIHTHRRRTGTCTRRAPSALTSARPWSRASLRATESPALGTPPASTCARVTLRMGASARLCKAAARSPHSCMPPTQLRAGAPP